MAILPNHCYKTFIMFDIFKSKTQRTIQIVEKLKELQYELGQRKKELNILYSNDFNHYDNIAVFAEKEYANVNGYKKRFRIIPTKQHKQRSDLSKRRTKIHFKQN